MNSTQKTWDDAVLASTEDSHPSTEITLWSQRLLNAVNKRMAYESGAKRVPPCEDIFEQRFYDSSENIGEMIDLGEGMMVFRDHFGSDFQAEIIREGERYSLSVQQVIVTVRRGAIDEPGDMIGANLYTIDTHPGGLSIQEIVDGPIEQAFDRMLAILNQIIEQSADSSRESLGFTSTLRHLPYVDAGTLSYTLGILGAALFMATAIGPGWLGFLASYLPTSILTTLAAAAHE